MFGKLLQAGKKTGIAVFHAGIVLPKYLKGNFAFGKIGRSANQSFKTSFNSPGMTVVG